MSWLKNYLSITEDAEAPDSYFYWSGLCAISAVLGNRVYIDKRFYKLFPNIFVFLVSKGSGLGKGVPVNNCKVVLEATGNCRLIVGQNSIEGIIKELSLSHTTKSGRVIASAEATLLAGEFGSFLLSNPKLFTDLTDLYDSQYNQGNWSKRLASQDTLVLKDICLTGLFAANEVHFREALPLHALKGGFLGRTICIYESKRRKLNDLLRSEEDEAITSNSGGFKDLANYLLEISRLEGEFILTKDAVLFYREWYNNFYNLNKDLKDDTGTAERLRDNILKIAMLLALSDKPTLRIEKQHIEEAMIQCFKIYSSTMQMVMGEGKSSVALITKPVLKILFSLAGPNNEPISRQRLLIRGSQTGDFDYMELDRVLEHLIQARLLKLETSRHGGPYYQIILENIKKLMET